MFNRVFGALVWGSQLVDLAVETKETVVRETRAAAIGMAGIGLGTGFMVTSAIAFGAMLVGALPSTNFMAAYTGTIFGAGLLVTAVSAIRVKQANDRLNSVKDMVTAKAAREAASQLASAGVDLALKGVASAQELASAAASHVTKRFLDRNKSQPS